MIRVNKQILKKRPISIRCPWCGKYHDWNGEELGFYRIPRAGIYWSMNCCLRPIKIWIEDENKIYVDITTYCTEAKAGLQIYAYLDELVCDTKKHEVRIEKSLLPEDWLGRANCTNCIYEEKCVYNRNSELADNDKAGMIEVGFKFSKEDWISIVDEDESEHDGLKQTCYKLVQRLLNIIK